MKSMVRPDEAEIDEAFFEVLHKEGFERLPSELLSYVKASSDGKSRMHVDVEVRNYVSGFGVTLQEVRAGTATRRQLLEHFRGIRAYRYETSDRSSIQHAVAEALHDLEQYGMPWLAGREVSTPATEQVRMLTAERAYQDFVRVGRERFRAGRYAEALKSFDEAATVKPLAAADEKYRTLADKKARGE
jgi:hypothetical protein